jgi:hypothetical protein
MNIKLIIEKAISAKKVTPKIPLSSMMKVAAE